MKEELISVIVPVYNVSQYIEKCILSIINQTYNNIEIVLIDDGSTDSSGIICDKYAELDKRIRVVHKENGGLSDARNTGLKIANGRWIAFIDSDDYIETGTLLELYRSAIDSKCQIAVCNMIRAFENGRLEPFYCPSKEKIVLEGEKRFETLNQPSVCNKLFKKELFNGITFPKGKYYEDTFVYHILLHRAQKIILTGYNGYYYFARSGSILGQPIYTDRYFDCVEAVYERAVYLVDNKINKYDVEACLSLYGCVSNAVKNIKKNKINIDKFNKMEKWYSVAYKHLINKKEVSIKQKLRLILLKYAPAIHAKIF